MNIPNKLIIPQLPLIIPSGISKIDENKIIENTIRSFFWKRLDSVYCNKANIKKGITSLFATDKGTVLKVSNYSDESIFFKFIEKGLNSKLFYPSYPSKKKSDNVIVNSELIYYMKSNKILAKKIWLGVLQDVKINLPLNIYSQFLKMYLSLYILILGNKNNELALDIFELLSVSKSNKANLLIVIQYINLENINARKIVAKKLETYRCKNIDINDIIGWMINHKIDYEELKDFTDIYKNFDTGFTNNIKLEKKNFEKITIKMDDIEHNFPLFSSENKYKKYNKLVKMYLRVLQSFKVNIVIFNLFYENRLDEFYYMVDGEAKINNLQIVDITEEILLFITDQYNKNIHEEEIFKNAKIYTESLLLQLTIPINDVKSSKNVLKL